ncbi:hypothetical protein [Pyxidicoccus trucidator]|uniref:hypothetical protein n=1 Tax=Pyxidicoccus trucidator TaxID=2709662 RepID=UPI0013DD28A4|nr:hypothetical protein [Pyxidicoccus trucidator]
MNSRVVVAVMFIMGAAACGGPEEPAAQAPRSGEEVFRGLVFGDGPVAELLPEFWGNQPRRELSPQQKEVGERVKAQLMADIHQADPGFFARFGVEIQSGKHLRIEQALKERNSLVKQVAAKHQRPEAAAGSTQGTCYIYSYDFTNTYAYDLTYAYDFTYDLTYLYDPTYTYDPYTYDPAYAYASLDDLDHEHGWAGGQLRHDEMIEMLATRLVAG